MLAQFELCWANHCASVTAPKDFDSIFSTLLPFTNAKLEAPPGMDETEGLEIKVAFNGVNLHNGAKLLQGMFRSRLRWVVSASGWVMCRTVPGRPGLQTPHFYWPAQPPTPHFYREGPTPTPHFYGPNPHFYWPTPHSYWPEPSLLLARPLTSICQARPGHAGPCRTVSDRVGTVPDRAVPIRTMSPCRPDTGTSLIVCWRWFLKRGRQTFLTAS